MIYNFFSSLKKLDEQILKVIVENIENFKPDFFQNALDCLSDTISTAIRQSATIDYQFTVLIESLWKFFVILIDISF